MKTLKWYGVCAIEAINGAYLVESPSTRRSKRSERMIAKNSGTDNIQYDMRLAFWCNGCLWE